MMRRLKTYIWLILFSSVPTQAWSQVGIKVIMNNNSTIKGQLVNINDNGDVKLLLNAKDTLVLKSHLIKKYDIDGLVGFELSVPKIELKKYKFHTEGSLLLGEEVGGWGLRQSFNRKVFGSLYSGITLGIDNYTGSAELNVYSVGANVRYYFIDVPKLPYFSFNAGYGSFHALQKYNQVDAKGGAYWSPAAGLTFGKKISFDLSLGLRFQNSDIMYQLGETESEFRWKYKRFVLNMGISF